MNSIKTSHSLNISNFLITLLFTGLALSFNLCGQCDARSHVEMFKLNKRMTLSDYDTEAISLDLPTLDAYDPYFSAFASSPVNQDYPSLIAPSPIANTPLTAPTTSPSPSPLYRDTPIPNPPVYGSSPLKNTPIPSPIIGPNTQPNPGSSSSVWCVARPTIPDPLLQRAMDYACGAGADCGPVKPNGPCFGPNTLVAHASYAFNSYWQRTKIVGGTCDFGGTAMLITVNPSYEGCQFV